MIIARSLLYTVPFQVILRDAGTVLSGTWLLQLRSYRGLNRSEIPCDTFPLKPHCPCNCSLTNERFLTRKRLIGRAAVVIGNWDFERAIPIVLVALRVLLFVGRGYQVGKAMGTGEPSKSVPTARVGVTRLKRKGRTRLSKATAPASLREH
jgi:hypothetical protein